MWLTLQQVQLELATRPLTMAAVEAVATWPVLPRQQQQLLLATKATTTTTISPHLCHPGPIGSSRESGEPVGKPLWSNIILLNSFR